MELLDNLKDKAEEIIEDIKEDIDKIFDIRLPANVETNLSQAETQKVLSMVLCPTFDLVPAVASELAIKRNAFNRLLKEQSVLLNFLEEQPYAVISGVAGTGKTMIAVEKARRHSEIGEKVLFLCFNRKLCDFLREKYISENVHYYTIDALACYLCNSSTADYSQLENTLMEMYYSGVFPYKHIIIDEGQDFGQNRIEESSVICTPAGTIGKLIKRAEEMGCEPAIAFGVCKYEYRDSEIAIIPLKLWELEKKPKFISETKKGYFFNYKHAMEDTISNIILRTF